MKGSKDLENARLVADHIGSIHHEVVLTSDEFFNAIPNVIKNIESFDTTTVRASVGNYLVGKYISENSDAKVILNGDGSDEVAGGYIYFLAAPNDLAFDQECRRLLDDIHYFDVLRSDRSISSNGLEPRTPFLDRTFVDTYMSIPANVRNPRSFENRNNNIWDKHAMDYKIKGMDDIASVIKSRPEKLLLRWSFDNLMPNLLPSSVLWRSKEAFSDGVSGDSGSWFEIIHANLNGNDDRMDTYKHFGTEGHMPPTTIEQLYYRRIFCQLYPNCDTTTPYFWMPKWVNATDASARTLKFYTDR
jgi:asparagine synthase (glutamine-hydrolysing)